jgi:ZIP family zinc transporter
VDLMLGALVWGALAASSLLVGTLLTLVRKTWPDGLVGGVLAFGAGALISSVAFELAQEGLAIGGPLAVALGVAAGALAFFFADRAVETIGGRSGGQAEGLLLALGALLDGIPEQAVLGIGLATGQGISVALLVAVFVSNLRSGLKAGIDGFAAGALLVMLVDQMVPEATKKAGNRAGLVTVLGFAVAAGLSNLS